MAVQLNHTIVWCHDKRRSADFLTAVLGLPQATPFGPMLVVAMANGVSLDFHDNGEVSLQHYAFLVSEAEFDQVFARVKAQGLQHWADPAKQRPGEINTHYDGRGMYFNDPDGNLLEVMTQPYGKWPEAR
jgi:catechol 2,3-dioxygenase-like lactoylglutathione lyase family enzyme